ncbi:MAG: MFS transporter [Alphaproteobacteria bacterium]|nr:MFS transporter [Alphaproteobacteria bacterium]
MPAPPALPARLPGAIWALGFTSLLMDLASEMIHGLLPIFLVTVLGVGGLALGLIEGTAEATASLVKLFSGAWSDKLGRRKPLALLGYGLAAATKPVFALASGVGLVVLARLVDRIGKGIRGAPRDALVADLVPPDRRGAAYGLRQSLDTIGAVLGPLAAMALMVAFADDVRLVFWLATIPAALAVVVLWLWVHEPPRGDAAPRPPIDWMAARRFDAAFWGAMAAILVLHLARFSEAFLLLRAQELGLDLAYVPLGLVAMNLVYAALAYPAGLWSDRVGRFTPAALGMAVMVAADLWLMVAESPAEVFAGAALWGLHMALTQGVLSALVADRAPAELRGTAFGIYHLCTGLALLPASAVAGLLWQVFGAPVAFASGAVLASAALIGLGLWRWRLGGPI